MFSARTLEDKEQKESKRKQAVACFRNGPLKNFTTCHKDQRCQDRIWPFPIGPLVSCGLLQLRKSVLTPKSNRMQQA